MILDRDTTVPAAAGTTEHQHGPEHEAHERELLAAALKKRTPLWKPVTVLTLLVCAPDRFAPCPPPQLSRPLRRRACS